MRVRRPAPQTYRIQLFWPDCGHSIEVESPTPAGEIRCPEAECKDHDHGLIANCPMCNDGVDKDVVFSNV
jgi:hypothetical protein